MESGFEVIYLGKRVSTEGIVAAAIAEDADAVGLSGLSGGLAHFAMKVRTALEEQDADIPVIAGGIDEPGEIEQMLASGVVAYLGPGTSTSEAVAAFAAAIGDREIA
jgi:methylmalonyl-CoA mutase C-terminal domain/subunit